MRATPLLVFQMLDAFRVVALIMFPWATGNLRRKPIYALRVSLVALAIAVVSLANDAVFLGLLAHAPASVVRHAASMQPAMLQVFIEPLFGIWQDKLYFAIALTAMCFLPLVLLAFRKPALV